VSTNIHADERRRTRLRGVQADGASIYRARRLQGLTQEALAAAAECDEKTIRRAEQGFHLDLATLSRIALALKMPYRRIIELRASRKAPEAGPRRR
jgi:transcriptional regulator with XRE-family HTH domain